MTVASRWLVAAAAIAVAFCAGFWFRGRDVSGAAAPGGRKILYWQDPMHPAYKSEKPGIAPDCGMQLEPVYADGAAAGAAPAGVPGSIAIDAARQQLAGIGLARAEKLAADQTMRLLGRVVVDETRIYRLFASADGWVRDIYPYAAGNIVKKDELLATYFSRDLLTPQLTYIYALNTKDQAVKRGEANPEQNRVIDSQLRNALEGLETLGLGDYQIREIARSRKASSIMELRAPATGIVLARNVSRNLRVERLAELYRMADLSRVWVLADVYEREAKLVPLGGRAWVRYEGTRLPAHVDDALPQFDPASRTLKVRLELDNPGYILRPDMFVDVEFPVRLPAAVTVPADAVLDSGLRKIVYVDGGQGVVEPRPVQTGWRFGDRIAILSGLKEGERVVASGTFLVDSESRMKLASGQAAKPEDPVCGMQVDPAKAIKFEYHGKTYYFCGEQCKREFQKEPARYLAPAKNGAHS